MRPSRRRRAASARLPSAAALPTAALACALTLFGCATPPSALQRCAPSSEAAVGPALKTAAPAAAQGPSPALPTAAGHAPPAATAHHSGRLSITQLGSQRERTVLPFELRGNAAAGELLLEGPLGARIARAAWSADHATLQQGADIQTFPDTQTLSQTLLGQPLPIQALFAWLQGQPAAAPGWDVDLSAHAQGRIRARWHHPSSPVDLLVVLDR